MMAVAAVAPTLVLPAVPIAPVSLATFILSAGVRAASRAPIAERDTSKALPPTAKVIGQGDVIPAMSALGPLPRTGRAVPVLASSARPPTMPDRPASSHNDRQVAVGLTDQAVKGYDAVDDDGEAVPVTILPPVQVAVLDSMERSMRQSELRPAATTTLISTSTSTSTSTSAYTSTAAPAHSQATFSIAGPVENGLDVLPPRRVQSLPLEASASDDSGPVAAEKADLSRSRPKLAVLADVEAPVPPALAINASVSRAALSPVQAIEVPSVAPDALLEYGSIPPAAAAAPAIVPLGQRRSEQRQPGVTTLSLPDVSPPTTSPAQRATALRPPAAGPLEGPTEVVNPPRVRAGIRVATPGSLPVPNLRLPHIAVSEPPATPRFASIDPATPAVTSAQPAALFTAVASAQVAHVEAAAAPSTADAEVRPTGFTLDTLTLGPVGAEVTHRGGHDTPLHVHFAVERSATAALISGGSDDLNRALAATGNRLDTVSVEVRGSAAGDGAASDAPRSNGGDAHRGSAAPPPPPRAVPVAKPATRDRFA